MLIMLSYFKGFSGGGATIREGALFRRNTVCEKRIKPFPKQALAFTSLQYKSFENVGKREIACEEQFVLFPLCPLPC